MNPESVTFAGPAGELEGRLHLPEGDRPVAGVVVCHPHPLMGGDLNNNVVMGVCRALVEMGMAALRFNFRGVGASAGMHDQGRGEVEDALAALRFMAARPELGGMAIGLAGYSFGAGVAMKAGFADDTPRALSVIGRARVEPDDELARRPSLPVQFVIGERDRQMAPEHAERLSAELSAPPEIHVIAGADHFFVGREREIGALVAAFLRSSLMSEDESA
ncbi:MAG: dienelactone hydrolase family protein [Chloroflexota bacterium]|nr:dienelactone hydrolase family protein [Chloroflexota bacterium]MDE2941430.1 dienelactone hydrolase family protein [Chloroflexota bacterium]MDE3267652.1 dienelactone hydrolase family protein [Chloroflexota bacterium]